MSRAAFARGPGKAAAGQAVRRPDLAVRPAGLPPYLRRAGSVHLSDWRRGIQEREGGAYGMTGARVGWDFGIPAFASLAIGGALGTPLGAPSPISELGGGFAPTAREPWWQLGFSALLRF